jgi:hypothetical protein
MRSKLVPIMLVLGLAVSGGAAGVIATDSGGGPKRADESEHMPGKGCGDQNAEDVREQDCEDLPK